MKNLMQNEMLCGHCHKSSPSCMFETKTENKVFKEALDETKRVSVKNRLVDKEYLVKYNKCPICGEEKMSEKIFIKTIN